MLGYFTTVKYQSADMLVVANPLETAKCGRHHQ